MIILEEQKDNVHFYNMNRCSTSYGRRGFHLTWAPPCSKILHMHFINLFTFSSSMVIHLSNQLLDISQVTFNCPMCVYGMDSYVSPSQIVPMFIVFRQEETTEGTYMCYTEDIGDLCIFLSRRHPLTVESSIYFMTFEDSGVATRTGHEFEPPIDAHVQPHWTTPSF